MTKRCLSPLVKTILEISNLKFREMVKNSCSLIFFLLFTFIGTSLLAQNNGENLFKATCAACHTIGKGRLVGPDLSMVYERADTEWIIHFVRSSQQMVKQGDSLAVALFHEYNQIPMPDNDLTDEQILGIIAYIRQTDSESSGEKVAQQEQVLSSDSTIITPLNAELANKGNELFYGYEKFKNGASSCIACHTIQNGSLLGGGKLSLNLTHSYSRLGEAGIKAILSNPPFPAMNTALKGKGLTEDEIQTITAMLQYVDQNNTDNEFLPSSGLAFAVLSFVLSMLILVNVYILYDNRKIPS